MSANPSDIELAIQNGDGLNETKYSGEMTVERLATIAKLVRKADFDEGNPREPIEAAGGLDGVVKMLGSDVKKGLSSAQVVALRNTFGKNSLPPTSFPSFLELFIGAFNDPILFILLAAAVVSLAIGLWRHPEDGFIEGTSILVACFLVGIITAVNDYSGQQQFLALEKACAGDDRCSVCRDGVIERINPGDIVVGDIMVLQAGDEIPADGLMIEGAPIKCNESSLTGEPDELTKTVGKDCFMYSSTLVTEAEECRAIAVGVGMGSQWGKIKEKLQTDPVETPLQEKLGGMCDIIGYLGGGSAALTFLALVVRAFAAPTEGMEWYDEVLDGIIISVTIIVVAIPEGLPLAVTIALAYSTQKMYEDSNLIRQLAACETMGNATNICSDKTGTLTENRMTVVEGIFADTVYDADSFAKIGKDGDVPKPLSDFVVTQACINRMAYLVYKNSEGETLHRPNIIGNKTEGALLLMAKEWGYDDEKVKGDFFDDKRDKTFSFNSKKKRSTTIITLPNGTVRVFCKGAPDWVLKNCTHYTDASGNAKAFTAKKRQEYDAQMINMADRALRTLCLCHRDFKSKSSLPSDWEDNAPDGEKLVMDCIVGIIDPLRSDVKEAVATAQRAGVTVRMVTGDMINTARAIAKQCGILTEGGEAIEGPTFRAMTPSDVDKLLPKIQVMARSSPDDKYLMVTRLNGNGLPSSKEEWEVTHAQKIAVDKVSWENDKDKIMPGYTAEWEESRPDGGEVVGVTGDGTNDAPALKAADVGLAMGITGTKVAQGASDIVILDDKFSSIVKAIMWGRSVFDNIRKFLQFQLTVNVVACAIVFIAAVSGAPEPLTAVQMLWVNLIMDTLGALALATEPPLPELLDRLPYKRTASLISMPMWRNIAVQSIFQLILMCILLFGRESIFPSIRPNEFCNKYENNGGSKSVSNGKSCDDFDEWCPSASEKCWDDDYAGKSDRDDFDADFVSECLVCKDHDYTHGTIMFNAFIFAQLFNEYNARSLLDDIDVWSGALKNPIFMGVSIVTVAMQVMLVEIGGEWLKTSPLTGEWWGITIGLGAISIPFGILMRYIPVKEDPESFARPKPIKVH